MAASFEMDRIRDALAGLTEDGKAEVTNALIYEAFELANGMEAEKDRLRRRLNDLVKRGELKRLAPGRYTYHPQSKLRHGEMYQRMWRAIRIQKPGFSSGDIAQITRADYSTASKYIKVLETEGYITRHGRKGNTRLYRTTVKGQNRHETVYPPLEIKNPFERECGAACRIVRALMERDPYQVAVKRKIVNAAWVIINRFDPEHKGANHGA